MKRVTFCAMLGTLVCLGTELSAQRFANWPVGVEREIDEGTYATVVRQENGWRLWRFESRSGIICQAVKSAVGRPHPIPVGVGDALWRGTPFLTITYGSAGSEYLRVEGRYSGGRREFRRPGERFWTPLEYNTPLDALGEGQIELHSVTWEYPSALIGMADERGLLNLNGVAAIRRAGRECATGGARR